MIQLQSHGGVGESDLTEIGAHLRLNDLARRRFVFAHRSSSEFSIRARSPARRPRGRRPGSCKSCRKATTRGYTATARHNRLLPKASTRGSHMAGRWPGAKQDRNLPRWRPKNRRYWTRRRDSSGRRLPHYAGASAEPINQAALSGFHESRGPQTNHQAERQQGSPSPLSGCEAAASG